MRAGRSVILGHLAVKNFALIEDVEVELKPGLNIITGETGAGKSLFVDAVQISLGRRGSSEYVRTGSSESVIQALFLIPDPGFRGGLLEDLGIGEEDGQVLVERQLRRDGNNRARINGRLASVTTIRNLASAIVDLHGQHEQHGLLSSREQLEMLDSLAGEGVYRLRGQVARVHRELGRVREEIRSNLGDPKERARQLDLLQYQLQEIDEADLKPDEQEQLQKKRNILGNLDLLQTGVAEFLGLVMEGTPGRRSVLDELGDRVASLGRMADIDGNLGEPLETLQAAQFEIEEVARTLRRYAEGLDFDPRALHLVEQRLDLIHRLRQKYGSSVKEVLEYRDRVADKILDIENSKERVEALLEKERVLVGELGALAGELSDLRRETASQVRVQVEEELADLSMENTQFDIAFAREPDEDGVQVAGEWVRCSDRGVDLVEFVISPNPGEPLRPLRQTASGGELARIMLALKNILAGADATPVLIFDEIDAGIGGEAGGAVARKLAALARSHQVLCVTHLPQIAAMADQHLHLRKETRGGRTISNLFPVTGPERIGEIARMLGETAGEAAMEHARQLLEAASKWKESLGGRSA